MLNEAKKIEVSERQYGVKALSLHKVNPVQSLVSHMVPRITSRKICSTEAGVGLEHHWLWPPEQNQTTENKMCAKK